MLSELYTVLFWYTHISTVLCNAITSKHIITPVHLLHFLSMTDDNDSDDYFHDSRDGSSDNDSDDNDGRSTLSSDDNNSSPLSPSSEHLMSHYVSSWYRHVVPVDVNGTHISQILIVEHSLPLSLPRLHPLPITRRCTLSSTIASSTPSSPRGIPPSILSPSRSRMSAPLLALPPPTAALR